MFKNRSLTQQSQIMYNKICLAIQNNDTTQCAHLSYDAFSSKSISSVLGILGHKTDIEFQKKNHIGNLLESYSQEYPHVLPPHFVSKLKNDPNYKNFSGSDQQFTMLTEAIISYNLPNIFPNVVSDCSLVMGRAIGSQYFPMFHTGQTNCDFRIINKLPSGKSMVLYGDGKRTSMTVINSRIQVYLNNPGSKNPIYSNVHITNDIDSQHVVNSDTFDFLSKRLQDTKDFYVINRNFYTADEYKAITEAVNESYKFERDFALSGKIVEYNKILYNASKFITSNEMCKLLNIPNLFP